MKTFKVNPKYVHFAIRKATGKIVNGWEQSEDIKHWSKIDLKDMFPDNKVSEFKVVGKKHCLNQLGIDPMNWDSWEKTSAAPEETIQSLSMNCKSLEANVKTFEQKHGAKPTALNIANAWSKLK